MDKGYVFNIFLIQLFDFASRKVETSGRLLNGNIFFSNRNEEKQQFLNEMKEILEKREEKWDDLYNVSDCFACSQIKHEANTKIRIVQYINSFVNE